MSDDLPSPSRVAVVGAGAVGSAFAQRLGPAGYAVRAIISRHQTSAEDLARQVGAPVAADTPAALPRDVRLVLLCVPDDALSDVAETFAALDHPWSSTCVAHTSGAHSTDVLAPLAAAGALTLSFHPLQSFTDHTPPTAFDGSFVGLEGDATAVAFGAQFARHLGAQHVTIPAEAKARVHLAAALASNGLVALMALVHEVLGSADLDPAAHTALIEPLVERTWEHITRTSPDAALTGPVARGDRATIATHLDALSTHLPHLKPAYTALTTEMIRAAVRTGKITADDAEDLLDRLHEDIK